MAKSKIFLETGFVIQALIPRPLTSSLIGSTIDTFLFFSISFYATGIPWVTLSLGDLAVKILVALVMLIPFRLLLGTFKAVKA